MRLQLECLPGDEPLDPRDDSLNCLWWLVLDGTHAVAFGALQCRYNPPAGYLDPLAGYLARCGVAESYRGQGLQRRLIAARERRAAELGLTSLHTDTLNNPESEANVVSSGFVQAGSKRIGESCQRLWKKELT